LKKDQTKIGFYLCPFVSSAIANSLILRLGSTFLLSFTTILLYFLKSLMKV